MLKKVSVSFLVFLYTLNLSASQHLVKADSLLKIIQLKDKHTQVSHFVRYLETHFYGLPLKKLDSANLGTMKILSDYGIENKPAYQYLIESVCQERLLHKNDSENSYIKAIDYARENKDHYLLTILLINLAYRQTEQGYPTGAISSYRLAKKEAEKMGDGYMQLIIDNNISDVYSKNSYYLQALTYLSQADSIVSIQKNKNTQIKADAPKLEAIIGFNKAEIFFRENEPDSLKVYFKKLQKVKARYYKLFTLQNRSLSYFYLLNRDYLKVIALLRSMKKNAAYKFDNRDVQDLAEALFKSSQTDSATFYIKQLLKDPADANRPDIKLHLYDLLGQIAENKKDYTKAASNFKAALRQSTENNYKLTQIGNVSSLIKIDEIENANNQRDEQFERERSWLVVLVIVALLTIVIIAIVYKNVKQKRHYENLLYNNTKKELAFINSHDVRRHLSNILGLLDLIRHSNNKKKEYLEAEEYLFDSAEYLDKAIRNIAEKLNE